MPKDEKEKTVTFAIDFETILDEMTVDEYIGVTRINPVICREFFGRYVSDGSGGTLDKVAGGLVVGQMSVNDLRTAAQAFFDGHRKYIINPTNGKD